MGCLVGPLRNFLLVIWLLASFGMLVSGCNETRLAWHCTETPEAVQVKTLEDGYRPGTDYLTLGRHLALVQAGVFAYNRGKHDPPITDAEKASPTTPITAFYYPVFSFQHPLAQGQDEKTAAWYKVLIKTHRYKTLGEVFADFGAHKNAIDVASLTGVVINYIDPLTTDEVKLLRDGFPMLSPEAVLVVEEGREPMSRGLALLQLVGGMFMLGTPLGLFVAKRTGAKDSVTAPVGAGPPPFTGAPLPHAPSVPPAASAYPPPAGAYPPRTASAYPPPAGAYPPASGYPSASGYPGSTGATKISWAPGERVVVKRPNSMHPGAVVRTQDDQVYVALDDGRKVWVQRDTLNRG
jgi:hypothetical protein